MTPADLLKSPDDRHFCFVVDTIAAVGDAIFSGAGAAGAAEGAGAVTAGEAAAGEIATVGTAAGAGAGAAGVGAAIAPELVAGGALASGALGGSGLTPAAGAVPTATGIPTSGTNVPGVSSPQGVQSAIPSSSTAPTGGPGGGAASISAPSSVSGVPGADVTQGTGGYSSGGFSSGGAGNLNLGSADFAGGTAPASIDTATPATGNSILGAIKNPSLDTIGTALSKNSNLVIPALGIGYEAIAGQQQPKGYNQTLSAAEQTANQSQQLESYLQNGTLPPGVQSSINEATQAAQASIRSKYASMGSSGSSAEAQELQAAQTAAVSQGAQIATQLLQTGINESQLSTQLYQAIMQEAIQQDQGLSSAIQSFSIASALSGLGKSS